MWYNIHAMSNDVKENCGLRVYDIIDPAKAVSTDVSQGSNVNNHQGAINFKELVDPTAKFVQT